jgi:hypothetical protein
MLVATDPKNNVAQQSDVPHRALANAEILGSHGPHAPQALVNYTRVTSAASVSATVNTLPLPEERQDDRSSLRRHLALMAVGVGAMLIGTEVVDGGSGTVLVLGGAGLSLYSLYQILQ